MLLEEGVAVRINDVPLLSHRVNELLAPANAGADKLRAMQARALALGDPTAARQHCASRTRC